MIAGGPYFDDLAVGQRFTKAPGLTLTDGAAAVHQAIVGDRLALALDAELSARVTGEAGVIAHPALVWDVAIGQSTMVTHRVIANLFYRGLVLRRAPRIGDTLSTVTEVVAMRETTRRPDRPPTGLAVLRITTVDQADRPVLDFWRCAMLPLRDPDTATGHDDDFDAIPTELDPGDLRLGWDGWSLAELAPAPHVVDGAAWDAEGGDAVTCAPELARLSLNVAMAHHDRTATGTGRRLVYGGHTIGIAAAQATRVIPELVTIVGWHGCDHLAPVYEDDLLRSRITVEACDGHLAHLRSEVEAEREDGERVAVLDWRYVAVVP